MSTPARILVIRFSSIGDLVLTTPVIRALQQQLGAEVHLLTKQRFAGLLIANPYLHRIHAFAGDWSATLSELRACRFDHIIDLHQNLRSARVRFALSAPARGFPKLNFKKWLLVNFKIDRMPNVHIVDRYFAAVAHLNVTNDNAGLDFPIPKNTERPGELPTAPYVAFAIGAAHATKRMPVEKIAEIIGGLTLPVVLLGGKDTFDMAKPLKTRFGDRVIDLCGKITLHQSALVLHDSCAVVTHDTGLMHIAAALAKPIVSIWGSTVPAFGMTPYPKPGMPAPVITEVRGLNCRPCSKIGYAACPKGHFNCMWQQDIPAIILSIEKILEK